VYAGASATLYLRQTPNRAQAAGAGTKFEVCHVAIAWWVRHSWYVSIVEEVWVDATSLIW